MQICVSTEGSSFLEACLQVHDALAKMAPPIRLVEIVKVDGVAYRYYRWSGNMFEVGKHTFYQHEITHAWEHFNNE